MAGKTVKSLVESCVKAACEEILLELKNSQIEEDVSDSAKSPPEEKKRKVESLTQAQKLQKAVDTMKKKLGEYLVGVHSRFRYEILEEYVPSDHVKLNSFLEVVLDDSFTNFKFPSTLMKVTQENQDLIANGSINLIQLVTQLCPNLGSLSISKSLSNEWVFPLEIQPTLLDSLSSLQHLTKLDRGWNRGSDRCTSFFSHIGTSCPKLKYLSLSFQPFLHLQKEQIIALVFGQLSDSLPQPVKNLLQFQAGSNLHHIQFDDQHLTPICKSLEYLQFPIQRGDPNSKWLGVFLLRHMPLLKSFLYSFDTLEAVVLLYQASQMDEAIENCQIIQENVAGKLTVKWTVNSPTSKKCSSISIFFFFSFSYLNLKT